MDPLPPEIIPPGLKGLGYAAPFAAAAAYLLQFILKRYDSEIQSRVNLAVSLDSLSVAVKKQNEVLERMERRLEDAR